MKTNADSELPGVSPSHSSTSARARNTLHHNIVSKRKSQSDVVNTGSRLTPETGIHGGDPRSKK
ncbi:hypothetical protein [Methanobacterium subterraneum]|uniref:hypothetical protein n=1 Tax=Methanobacterium subterraneum TaxID=59277 RepID=UPI0012FFE63B|nr:hypothetical protein [Methanobacterium subterraneum]